MTVDRHPTVETAAVSAAAHRGRRLRPRWPAAFAEAVEPVPLHPSTNAPAGILVSNVIDDAFDHAGTNPRYTDAEFDTLDYYDPSRTGLLTEGKDRLFVKVKTREQLLALPSPPPNPFTVTATVSMENDEGQTATSKITYTTRWDNRPKKPSSVPVEGGTGDNNG